MRAFTGDNPPPDAVATRAKLVETFRTDIFITRGAGWMASAYLVQ